MGGGRFNRLNLGDPAAHPTLTSESKERVKLRGGVLNRLSIAAFTGLLAIGLTPALTNLAFADGIDNAAKSVLVKVTYQSATSASLLDSIKTTADVKLSIEPADGNIKCPDLTITKDAGELGDGTNGVYSDTLKFKTNYTETPDSNTVCNYTIKQTAGSNDRIKYDPAAFKLTWNFTKGSGTPDSWAGTLVKYVDGNVSNTESSNKQDNQTSIAFTNIYTAPWKVTYLKADGTSELGTEEVENNGSLAKIPTENLCDTGAGEFLRWQKENPDTNQWSDKENMSVETITADTKYKAICGVIVTFDPNGGKFGTKTKPDPVKAKSTAPKTIADSDTPKPTRDGYKFKQWCDTKPADGETCDTKSELSNLPGSKTVFASWTKNPVVTLDKNGGQLGSGSQETNEVKEDNKQFAKPTDPTPPSGQTFMYWSKDKENPTEVNFPLTVDKNTTLHAIYGYKVTYKMAEDSTQSDKEIGTELVVAGKDATGKAKKSTAEVTWDYGAAYCNNSAVFKEWKVTGGGTPVAKGQWPKTVNSNLTLTAQCDTKVTVKFVNNASSPQEIGTQEAAAGARLITKAKKSSDDVDLTDSTKVCSPDTDQLKGWVKVKNAGTDVEAAQITEAKKNPITDLTTLTAADNDEYQAVCETPVTVKFHYGDNGATEATQKLLKGKNLANKASSNGGTDDVDLTAANEATLCGAATKYLVGWDKKDAAAGAAPITDLTTETAATDAEYTAKCETYLTATFKKASDGHEEITKQEKLKKGETPKALKDGTAITATQAGCPNADDLVSWEPALGPIEESKDFTAKCTPKPVTPPAPVPGGEPSQRPEPSTPGTGSGGSGSGWFGGWGGYVPSGSSDAGKQDDGKKPQPQKPAENAFDKQFTKKLELPKGAVARSAGQDRVATSLSALGLAKNHEVVVLATGSNFPDALVGGALAGAFKAGVVLTTASGGIEPSIVSQLKASGTKRVQIVGGFGAVSKAKEDALRAAGFQVTRIAGQDRYETAKTVKDATRAALGLKAGAKAKMSCNATGANFPDALACASAASLLGGVVDLVKPGQTVAADSSAEQTVCAGGQACVESAGNVTKIVGSDRYETAYRIAQLAPATGKVVVANAKSAAADSLVASALSASMGARLFLSNGQRVNVPAGTTSAQLIGGTRALPANLAMFTK